jgi:hypothetical protein
VAFLTPGDYIKKKTEEVLLTLGIVKVGDDDGLFKKVADNGANMVKGWNSLGCLDHTIERSVMKLWNDAQVKESFEKGKKVVTFFKSSTIGRSELAKVQEDLYGNKLGMLKQECKTRWSSTHNCGLSLMKAQESIQQFCVQERMTDVEGNHFKMGVDDWDIIGQCTASLMTVAAVVKQAEGDKYPTSSLVLPFMNSCMRSLSEDAPIKQTWLGTANVRREFPVSSAHACVQSVRKNIREDMEDRWVTNLSEDRKRFYLVSSLLDPRTKMLSFCDNKYFPSSWKDDALGYLSMELKSFYVQPTQGEEKDTDEQVKSRSDLDELLGMSTTSMDFDVASVEGEGQLQAYIQVQQVPNDTDPLMWWKQHQQEFPDLARMARQYLAVPATSASPERFFSRVGLVQTDLRGRLLDTTMIDLMWAKQAP